MARAGRMLWLAAVLVAAAPGGLAQVDTVELRLPQTLPGGGATESEKLSGTLPTSAHEASFFFALSRPASDQRQHGLDYAFECRLQVICFGNARKVMLLDDDDGDDYA